MSYGDTVQYDLVLFRGKENVLPIFEYISPTISTALWKKSWEHRWLQHLLGSAEKGERHGTEIP